MKRKGRLLLVFSVIAVLVVLFSQCMDTSKSAKATETTIAGAKTCVQCHKDISNAYLKNVHYAASAPIESNNQINLGADYVYEYDENLKVAIEKRDSGTFQVVYFKGKEELAKRFDIAIGAGKNAYTYASWRGDILSQLPLSFFKQINGWANSPGFRTSAPDFGRIIESRCLECHSSFIESKNKNTNSLVVSREMLKSSLVYGIDCERCHGPAGKHVEFHLKNPDEKEAKFMVLYKTLTRKQRVDACGVCHSGNDAELLKSTFSFKPGDDLKQYYAHLSPSSEESQLDVHGQQNLMLEGSKCFTKSNSLECSTCHSPHDQIKGSLTLYSKKCISCHSSIKHTEKTLANAMVKTNCIDCHMPLKPSKVISFQQAGQSEVSPYMLRSHRIAVY
nr:multiheme c-type cytochrome [Pedobacter panaciterrae]